MSNVHHWLSTAEANAKMLNIKGHMHIHTVHTHIQTRTKSKQAHINAEDSNYDS